ncbi:MAG TPA: LLM class F420-dependent oxidoreductase [Trebonia sp.]|nr:LLM class F420-dependent oxidoreductase [Trebonia sp.]
MKLGLHISDFTWDGGAPALRFKLGEIARRAEEAGVDRISVMDHLWQIGTIGPAEHEMLEAYTTLGWLAARTERVRLLAMVTAVVYRAPGLLAKAVTTLDVLSGGRAILGIGAAWNADESAGLGLLFPPVAERFERLEEAILICRQMWSGDESPFEGKHYQLARTLNSPQVLSEPHPPILIGGAGEKKTLKLVARYADACNIAAYELDQTAHKLDVLRQHCADEGRDYDDIEKTAQTRYDLGEKGENVSKTIEHLHRIAELGFTQVHGSLLRVSEPGQLDLLAEQVIPAVEKF